MKEIFIRGSFSKIDADNSYPATFRNLLGFLVCNNGRDCFAKFQGNIWMITREGAWERVCRNLSDLTYNEYLKLSLS